MLNMGSVKSEVKFASIAFQKIYMLARTAATKPVGQRPSVWGPKDMVSVDAERMRAQVARVAVSLMQAERHIGAYMDYDATDPTVLAPRFAKLTSAYEALQGAGKDLTRDILHTFSNVIDEDSWDTFERLERNLPIWLDETIPPILDALGTINSFYTQNTESANYLNRIGTRPARLEQQQKGFTKTHTKRGVQLRYNRSKGVVNQKEVGSTRHEQSLDRRLARDFKGLKRGDYVRWLATKDFDFWVQKTTVYKVAAFLLENNIDMLGSSRRPGIGSSPKSKREYPQNLLKFRKGRLWGLYTFSLEQVSGATSTVAKLGRGSDGQVSDFRMLHTLNSWVREGNKNVQFVTRTGEIGPQETPQSIKYVMRHDYLYAGLKPQDDKHSHADDIDFKSIQAAGGLVAQNGKILVIDNASGHYQPGYLLLEQATRLVQSNGAFAPNALVGVVSKNRIAYFPVTIFLALATNSFDESIWTSAQVNPRHAGKVPRVMDQTVSAALQSKLFSAMESTDRSLFLKGIQPT
ncbi:MAG: hypothetical protein ABFS86_01580 [Planctomycetota bacterium]